MLPLSFDYKNDCWIISLCNFLYIYSKYRKVTFCQNYYFSLKNFEDITDKILSYSNFIYQILFYPQFCFKKKPLI